MTQKHRMALVTGASSGIGKSIAERLLKDGLTVYVAARSVDKMADLADKGAIVLALDITKEEQIETVAARILEEHGGVDVLVNNEGYGQYGPVEDTPIDTARYQFEVNLFGLARLTQLLLPAMRDKRQGLIIQISSIGGKVFTPLGAWYHATKHALEGWSDCLRLELKPFGIDVVIIEPGFINTGFADTLGGNLTYRKDGAYADFVGRFEGRVDKSRTTGEGSPPRVVAATVARAVRASRPRTRYATGQMARPLLFMRWILSDRTFERIIVSQFS